MRAPNLFVKIIVTSFFILLLASFVAFRTGALNEFLFGNVRAAETSHPLSSGSTNEIDTSKTLVPRLDTNIASRDDTSHQKVIKYHKKDEVIMIDPHMSMSMSSSKSGLVFGKNDILQLLYRDSITTDSAQKHKLDSVKIKR